MTPIAFEPRQTQAQVVVGSVPHTDPYTGARAKLVESIARNTGIDDPRILGAFAKVPRHLFVPERERPAAYLDRALPIGANQTISQPSMIAIMLMELDPGPLDQALEVGSGSGYAAALLAELVREVDAVELRTELATRARQVLADLGYENVRVHATDGSFGLAERAPFDKILVSAGARSVPEALIEQLAVGGRIAIPVGSALDQSLLVGEREESGGVSFRSSTSCVFVPLITQSRPYVS